MVKLLRATLVRRLTDPASRYYLRKQVTLGGWLAVALLIPVVFQDRLGGLPVAIGVASAGIAFALQEVIGSIAGWIAISFGNFYAPGDRV
jgi:small-conductance mechanosensitive channel